VKRSVAVASYKLQVHKSPSSRPPTIRVLHLCIWSVIFRESEAKTRSKNSFFRSSPVKVHLPNIERTPRSKMLPLRALVLCALVSSSVQDSVISGYGPVNLEDLHPLTLSWNQACTCSALIERQLEEYYICCRRLHRWNIYTRCT
jgi:hypothetical protein